MTASRMVATVHNGHNRSFKEQFAVWSRNDPIYNIRFFCADEFESLMKYFCKGVTVLPMGGGTADELIVRGLGPNAVRCFYRLRGRFRRSIREGERVMCIGEVVG
jgi:hypothetical protein